MDAPTGRIRGTVREAGQWLHGRVEGVVRRLIDDITGPSWPLGKARMDDLNRRTFRATQILAGTELQLDAIDALLAPPSGPFHPEMTMADVLRRHPDAQHVLATVGLPGCGGCAVRHDETLAEAIDAYGFDGPSLLVALNGLLSPSAGEVVPHDRQGCATTAR